MGGSAITDKVVYDVYANSGAGDSVNYTAPKATASKLSWTSQALSAPGSYKFAVRARDARTGLEERNVDALVVLTLDGAGNDVTLVPAAPLGLRAFPMAGGKVRVEWTCASTVPSRQPAGFNVYWGAGGIDYSHAAASVPWSAGRFGSFLQDLTGLTGGVSYSIGVRAFSSAREELNTNVVVVNADSTPPSLVDSLVAIATDQE
jgi:hypothetical protein